MTSFYKTLSLALLVTLLMGYVIWDFTSNLEKEDVNPDEIDLLAEVSRESIAEVLISSKAGEVGIKFTDGKCRIQTPVEDLCDPVVSDNLLNHLNDLRGVPNENLKPEEMGLQSNEGTRLVLKFSGGKEETIRIGDKNTFDGRFYVQSGNKFFISSRETVQLTNKNLKELRDHRVWRGPNSIVEIDEISVKIDFEGIKETYALKREGEVWTLKHPPDDREVSSDQVQEWLGLITNLRAQEILPVSESSFLNMSMDINFLYQDKSEYGLSIRKAPQQERVLVVDSNKDRMMSLNSSSLKSVRVPFSYFFNPRKPFQFPLEHAVDLYMTRAGVTEHFKKEDVLWVYQGKKEGFEESKLPDFFSRLQQLEVKTYLKPQKWFGLESPNQKRIRILDKEGKSLFDMTWGDKFKPTQGPQAGVDLRYAQVKGQKFSFGVLSGQIDELLSLDFFKKESPPEEDPHDHEGEHDHAH